MSTTAVVASRYARALIEALAADSAQSADAGLDQLRRIESLLESETDARKLLVNPVIPSDRRSRFVGEISRALGLDARVGRLLGLIVERRRLDILDDLIEAYQKLLDEKNGIVRAVVTALNCRRRMKSGCAYSVSSDLKYALATAMTPGDQTHSDSINESEMRALPIDKPGAL